MSVDLVGSLIVWLRPRLPDASIGAQVPRTIPGQFVLVRRLGGPFQWPVIDTPTVGVECWAPTQPLAHDLCQDVRALVWSLRGASLNGVAVYRVEEVTGPSWLPDPEHENTPRYVLTVTVQHREHLPVS